MSGQRAPAEPYTTRFETEISAIDERNVWLERSYFYGNSGGQPADHGTIGGTPVTDVRLVDGEPVHVLAEDASFRPGQRVLCSIDWSFRMYCMRAHTAAHVCYGAATRLLEDVDYAGLDIDDRRVSVSLETTSTVDDETLLDLDEDVNRVVWESRSVSWGDVPIAEARERDEITFSDATDRAAVHGGRVRVVTIGDDDENAGTGASTGIASTGLNGGGTVTNGGREPWDVTACPGTHVRNTREIGPVTVLGRSTDEDVVRIELAVGPRAIERRTAEKRAAFAATRSLDSSVERVPDELDRIAGVDVARSGR